MIDASAAIRACQQAAGFAVLGEKEIVAPHLLWSEFRSVVHERLWRGEITAGQADLLRRRLGSGPVRRRDHARLDREAWAVAEELGWAKTYDAEYVALARILGCRLVTVDGRLRRGADRLGFVVTPAEL